MSAPHRRDTVTPSDRLPLLAAAPSRRAQASTQASGRPAVPTPHTKASGHGRPSCCPDASYRGIGPYRWPDGLLFRRRGAALRSSVKRAQKQKPCFSTHASHFDSRSRFFVKFVETPPTRASLGDGTRHNAGFIRQCSPGTHSHPRTPRTRSPRLRCGAPGVGC